MNDTADNFAPISTIAHLPLNAQLGVISAAMRAAGNAIRVPLTTHTRTTGQAVSYLCDALNPSRIGDIQTYFCANVPVQFHDSLIGAGDHLHAAIATMRKDELAIRAAMKVKA